MQVSALHVRAADLAAATHDVELGPGPETIVHLDAAHRGLGTAAAGPTRCGPTCCGRARTAGRGRWKTSSRDGPPGPPASAATSSTSTAPSTSATRCSRPPGRRSPACGGLGARTVFLSNNPTHEPADYAAKLTRLGLPTTVDDILVSTQVLVRFLLERMPGARLLVLGEPPLERALAAAGFGVETTSAAGVEAVIASFDRTLVYAKLQAAFDAIRAGARFFATNGDRYCPVPGGGEPDAAAVIAAIEASRASLRGHRRQALARTPAARSWRCSACPPPSAS